MEAFASTPPWLDAPDFVSCVIAWWTLADLRFVSIQVLQTVLIHPTAMRESSTTLQRPHQSLFD